MGLADCCLVLLASLLSALLAEGLSWLLVYRTEGYQNLRDRVDRLSKKLERKKQAPTNAAKRKSKDKRVSLYEQQLQEANKELNFSRMKSMFAVGFTLFTLFGIFNSYFAGRVIARLPFEPFSLLVGISHRGLSGTDYHECSMAFLYALCSISLRTNIQKYLGFAPKGNAAAGSWFTPPQ